MTVIFWSGKGWLVPAVSFGASLAAEVISESLTGNSEYYQTHGLALALALWVSAGVNALVAWQFYSPLLSPPKSKKKGRAKRSGTPGWIDHSFMFINQGVWAVILVVSGFAALISRGI